MFPPTMLRTVLAGALVLLAQACTGTPDRTAHGSESPDDDAGATPTNDASQGASDGDAAGDGEAAPDAGADATAPDVSCRCVHGSCDERGACSCDPAYAGELCDEPTFVGSGRDGPLVVDAFTNLTWDNRPGRTCGDGGDAVSYPVVGFDSTRAARLATTPSSGCLAEGDEVLVINMRGTSTSVENVGRMELLEIAAVDGDLVTFTRDKHTYFGEGANDDTNLGVGGDQQRVVLQRVPHYTKVTVTSQQMLTMDWWNGYTGGVLAFRASERVVIAGRLDMWASGYAGGYVTSAPSTTGEAGESIRGYGARSANANQGGGGGGTGDGAGDVACQDFGFAGGGGGHAGTGQAGSRGCAGAGGAAYGAADRWLMGSGGGAGGTDNTLTNNPEGGYGGYGGGIIAVFARELHVFGAIDVTGEAGQGDAQECGTATDSTSDCWDWSGPGGGGAGGTIHLEAETLALGDNLVRALGGSGGNGQDAASGNGGDGGAGRITIKSYAGAGVGTTNPPAITP